MIRRLIQRAPSTFGWAATAACAFLGTRFSGDPRLTAAVWAMGGLTALLLGLMYQRKIRIMAQQFEREVGIETAALSMGRRAPSVMLTVTEPDGTLYARTLAQILTDITPEGRDIIWHEPVTTVLWYLDPHDTYVKADHGEPR